jgi:hypothetical protein
MSQLVVTRDIDMNPEPNMKTIEANLDQADPIELEEDNEAQPVTAAPVVVESKNVSPRKPNIRNLFAINIIS